MKRFQTSIISLHTPGCLLNQIRCTTQTTGNGGRGKKTKNKNKQTTTTTKQKKKKKKKKNVLGRGGKGVCVCEWGGGGVQVEGGRGEGAAWRKMVKIFIFDGVVSDGLPVVCKLHCVRELLYNQTLIRILFGHFNLWHGGQCM